jgi:hypothetical protein
MIRTLLQAVSRPSRIDATPTPDRMCGAYGVLIKRLFGILPHEHTRLEVQQMLYTAQVLSIARNGRPLFQNQFTATRSGPVLLTLWRLQSTTRGLDQIMHPIHSDLIDAEDRDVIESVADALGRLDASQISVYANSSASAAARRFVAWVGQNTKRMRKGPDGFLGDAPITLADLESEVRRRYAGRNALETAEGDAGAQTASGAMTDAGKARTA